MKMFMLKSFAIASIMFISVLAGIQIANNGLNKLKGQPVQTTMTNPPIKSNNANRSTDLTSHNLEAKKQKLEEINGQNLFSEMGKKVADGVANTSKSLINSITSNN
ncbi:DUF3679 domain-containing protein [Neobacillus sp. SM06]|uniref:DUF3679 domain-containing protein n=1 Tax=Neobacillus sp. SM06 TaxID=3422492 RepID=UPI003D290D73